MKIKKIFAATFILMALCSGMNALSAESEIKKLKQISEHSIKVEISTDKDASYVLEVFAPNIESPQEWTPGDDAQENAKELIYVEQGRANAKGNIITTFNIEGERGEYVLRYSVNGEMFDATTFEFDDEFQTSSGSSGGRGSSSSKGGSSSANTSKPIALPIVTETQVNEPILMDIYADIQDVIWARNAIVNLTNQGIVSGKGKDIFAPRDMVTREEFVKMLVCAFSSEVIDEKTINFSDVSEDAWYYSYIKKAFSAGIVTGFNEEVFGVGQNITRQDIAVMTYRAALSNIVSENDKTDLSDFDDVAEYAKNAVLVMSEKGIINGKGDGKFYPNDYATRAEAAKIIYETMQVIF